MKWVNTLSLIVLFLFLGSCDPPLQNTGYVLGPGEGESLGPRRTIKASPKSGAKQAVMVLDSLPPGFETTFHIHEGADEFFYVISGDGTAELDEDKYDITTGSVIFVPGGMAHNLSVSEEGPMQLLFFFDRPGADEWFREAHEKFFSKSLPLSVEDCNEMGKKYGYICLDR